jgi:surface polysaccharide O-acyltransferase-like enzyme
MLMIIGHHFFVHADFQGEPLQRINRALYLFAAQGWGKAAVDGFVLLTGYFLCTSKAAIPNGKKILKIVLQTLFYSFVILFAFGFTNLSPIFESPLRAGQYLMPLTQGVNWYATAYIILLLVAPFLNLLIRHMDQKAHLRLLLILFAVFAVIPSVIQVSYASDNLTGFALLYLFAAYMRLYPPPLFEKRSFALGLIAAAAIVYVFYLKALEKLMPSIPYLDFLVNRILGNVLSLPSIALALGLFLLFKNIHVKHSKIINWVATTTFGIYLFHDNPLMWQFLWVKLFHNAGYTERFPALWLHLAWVVPAVFLMGMALDCIRQNALEKPLFRLIDCLWAKRKLNERRSIPHE